MKFLFVGGDADGETRDVNSDHTDCLVRNAVLEKEHYIRLSVKGGTDFFMLAGMTPVEGLKRWRELTGLKQPG